MMFLTSMTAALALWAPAQESAAPAEAPHRMRVTLQNGRVYTGDVTIDGAGDLTLSSKSVGDGAALEFPAVRSLARLDDLGRVMDVEVDVRVTGPGRSDYGRLYRNQRVVGRLTAVDEGTIGFESVGFGPLTIPRAAMGELIPLGGAGEGAVKGLDLERWKQWKGIAPDERRGISIGSGGVRLGKVGATIELAEPPRDVRVELGVEWRGMPEFALRLGSGERAPRIEVWDGAPTLIAWGEGGEVDVRQADAKLAMDTSAVLHLVFEGGRAGLRAVELSTGERVQCDLFAPLAGEVPALAVEALGRPMEVFSGTLRVLAPLAEGQLSPPRSLRGGELIGFDPSTRILELDGERMELDGVPLIRFVGRQEAGLLDQEGARPGRGQLVLTGGEMIEITGARLEGGSIRIAAPHVDGELTVPLASIQRLELPVAEPVQLTATYQILMGHAVDSAITAGLRRLEPVAGGGFALTRSEPGFKGEVTATVDEPLTLTRSTTAAFAVSNRTYPHQVVLRTGETFPARVTFGEGGGITATTPFTDAPVQVGRGSLRAVMLDPRRARKLIGPLEASRSTEQAQQVIVWGRGEAPRPPKGTLTTERVERALLVPRAQGDAPGTHLLAAANGDLLRTTVVGQTESAVEVQDHGGATMEIPVEVLALCVPLEEDGDVAPVVGPWVLDLGGRALLAGELVSGTQERFVLDHAVLGRVEIPTEAAGLVTYRRPLEGRHDSIAGWRAVPMPEPKLPD